MIKLRSAGAGALVAALALTACTTSAHDGTVPAPCARADAEVRQDALEVAPLSGVTTSRGLAAAAREMGPMGRMIATVVQARSQHGGATVIVSELHGGPATPLPPQLSTDVRRVTADVIAVWTAVTGYENSTASARSVGDAAQRTMRDFRAIRAACAAARR